MKQTHSCAFTSTYQRGDCRAIARNDIVIFLKIFLRREVVVIVGIKDVVFEIDFV